MPLSLTLNAPLSLEELKYLNQQLLDIGDANIFMVHGLLCALISGPRIIPMQDWMPLIKNREYIFDSPETVESFTQMVMRLNNQLANAFLNNNAPCPLICIESEVDFAKADFTEMQWKNLSYWCQGYFQGVTLDQNYWLGKGDEALTMMLLPIMLFATDFEEEPSAEKIAESRQKLTKMLPRILPSIYNYWREKLTYEEPEAQHKIGRNEPCPCGSGKKFKKCCLQ